MNPTTELCFCPVGDVGLQVHFPGCGDPGWRELHDVEEASA